MSVDGEIESRVLGQELADGQPVVAHERLSGDRIFGAGQQFWRPDGAQRLIDFFDHSDAAGRRRRYSGIAIRQIRVVARRQAVFLAPVLHHDLAFQHVHKALRGGGTQAAAGFDFGGVLCEAPRPLRVRHGRWRWRGPCPAAARAQTYRESGRRDCAARCCASVRDDSWFLLGLLLEAPAAGRSAWTVRRQSRRRGRWSGRATACGGPCRETCSPRTA